MSTEHGQGNYGIADKGTHFRTRQTYGSYWRGQVDVLTVTPKVRKTSSHHVFVPGYSANSNPEISEEIATNLALNIGGSVDVFTVSGFLRGHRLSKTAREEFPHEPVKNKVKQTARHPMEINRAALLVKNLRDRNIQDARVVPNSLGTQSSVYAISLGTEGRIKDGVAVAAAGINNERPVKSLIKRFILDGMREDRQARKDKKSDVSILTFLKSSGAMIAKHPIRFLWHEIRAAKYGNVVDDILSKKVNMQFLAGSTDEVFGVGKTSKRLEKSTFIYKGGHNKIYTDPEFVKEQVAPLLKKNYALAA